MHSEAFSLALLSQGELFNRSFKPTSELTNANDRTGQYKLIWIIGGVSAITAYSLMILRWHRQTSLLESLYIIPGGFGNGIALSASFIGLTAGVEPCKVAIASSGLYLSSNSGMVGGLSVAAAILQTTLRKQLRISLEGLDGKEEVIMASLTRRHCQLTCGDRLSPEPCLILIMCSLCKGELERL